MVMGYITHSVIVVRGSVTGTAGTKVVLASVE